MLFLSDALVACCPKSCTSNWLQAGVTPLVTIVTIPFVTMLAVQTHMYILYAYVVYTASAPNWSWQEPSGPLSSGVVFTSPGCRFDACIRPMGSGNLKYAPKYIPHAILVNVHAAAGGAKLLWQLRGQVAEPCNFFLQNAAMHKTHKHELFQHVYKKKEKPAMFRPLTQQPPRGLIYFQHLKPFNWPCCFN